MIDETDYILIKDFELEAKIGAFEAERETEQRLVVDLRIGIDLMKAGKTGELADTICYLTASQRIKELITGRSWELVEQVAKEVIDLLFEFDPRITSVRAGVRKFVIPGAKYAGVEVERSRKLKSAPIRSFS